MYVASFDIETSNLSANFGIVLCAVIQPWQGKQIVLRKDEFDGVNSDDSKLVGAVIQELNRYNVLIAHNGVRFDRPFLNTRAAKWGLEPLSPRGNFVDPVFLARKHLRMSYNGLDTIAKYLHTKHQKTPLDPDLWVTAVLDQNKESLDQIVHHCKNDVFVLEEITEKLIGFVGRINEWGSA